MMMVESDGRPCHCCGSVDGMTFVWPETGKHLDICGTCAKRVARAIVRVVGPVRRRRMPVVCHKN